MVMAMVMGSGEIVPLSTSRQQWEIFQNIMFLNGQRRYQYQHCIHWTFLVSIFGVREASCKFTASVFCLHHFLYYLALPLANRTPHVFVLWAPVPYFSILIALFWCIDSIFVVSLVPLIWSCTTRTYLSAMPAPIQHWRKSPVCNVRAAAMRCTLTHGQTTVFRRFHSSFMHFGRLFSTIMSTDFRSLFMLRILPFLRLEPPT